jgi:ubiquinone/menaquinone biosynthesis C-methylase UbiE
MENYSVYAKYYDSLHGEPKDKVALINEWIQKYNPKATSVLEIACGTGAILKLMEKHYEVSGLDLSKEMLSIARKKISKGNFYHKDMTSFSLNKKFDIILCVYDSINHLLKFNDWTKVFKNSSKHLNANGLFIFDINTLAKINKIESPRMSIQKLGKDLIVNKMSTIARNKLEFHARIFENKNKNSYKLFEQKIVEVSFEKEKIINALNKQFKVLLVFDPKRKSPSKNSERLYFVCKLR